MNFYREAAKALRQNTLTVGLYFVASLVVGACAGIADIYVLSLARTDTNVSIQSFVLIFSRIGLVAIDAVLQTIIFSRIGRDMDRPMWRVADDRDALRLFYRLWLLLGLMGLAYMQIIPLLVPLGGDAQSQVLFLSTGSIWSTLLIVFGSSVMFYGRAGSEELNQAFSTMTHHIMPTVAIMLVGLLAGSLLNIGSIVVLDSTLRSATTAQASMSANIAYVLSNAVIIGTSSTVTVFIFAYAWLVCIFHRDHYEEPGDDFDF